MRVKIPSAGTACLLAAAAVICGCTVQFPSHYSQDSGVNSDALLPADASPPPQPVGDVVSNLYTCANNSGGHPSIAASDMGFWTVAWTEFVTGEAYSGIRYTPFHYDSGAVISDEGCLALNVTVEGSQFEPKGAGLPGGPLLFAYYSAGQGHQAGVQGRFVDPATGEPSGPELHFPNSDAICAGEVVVGAPWIGFSPPTSPSWTVVWQETSESGGVCQRDQTAIHASRLNREGEVVMWPMTVSETTIDSTHVLAGVGVDGEGRSLVVWQQMGARTLGLLGRIIHADGTMGPILDIVRSSNVCHVNVAGGPEGFMVVFSYDDCADGIPEDGVVGGMYVDPDGSFAAAGLLPADASSVTVMPAVAYTGSCFLVAWSNITFTAEDGNGRIMMRRFYEDGEPVDHEDLPVHPPTGLAECVPSIAADGNGNIGIAWQSCPANCPTEWCDDFSCTVKMRFFSP